MNPGVILKSGLVSVFIPSYNYQRYLGSAIDSILGQTYAEWELIIVDDASTDDSRALIERYRRRYPDRIRAVLLKENVGQSEATNIGLSHARGEFVSLLASDDVARPQRLADGVAFLKKRPDVAAVFSKVGCIDANGSPLHGDAFEDVFNRPITDMRWDLLSGNFLCATSVVARLGALKEVGGFNRRLGFVEDYDLWLRLLDRYELARIDDVWVDYRLHGQNLSVTADPEDVRLGALYESAAVAVRAMHRWPFHKLGHVNSRPGTHGYARDAAAIQCRLAETCMNLEDRFFSQLKNFGLPSPGIAAGAAYQFALDALQSAPDSDRARALLSRIYEAIGDVPRARGEKSITLGALKTTSISPPVEVRVDKTTAPGQTIASAPESAYVMWLRKFDIGKIYAHHYDQLMAQGRLGIRFHLAIVVTPEEEAYLARTIQSITAQLLLPTQLTIVATTPAPAGFESSRLHWHCVAPDTLIATAGQAFLKQDAQWCGLIRPGDRLAQGALLRIAEAVERHPRWKVVYTDDDLIDQDGTPHSPQIKPAFDLTLARSLPYVDGLILVRWDALAAAGGLNGDAGEATGYDILLRTVERSGIASVGHVSIPQLHRLDTRPRDMAAFDQVRQAHLQRQMINANVRLTLQAGGSLVEYPVEGSAIVSIVMPTRDRVSLLSRALESLLEKTSYPAFELIIVDHASRAEGTQNFLSGISALNDPRLKVVSAPSTDTLTELFNRGAAAAQGSLLLFLHDDVAALHADWLERMVAHAMRPGIGAVGARLVSADGRLQHAGIGLGLSSLADLIGEGAPLDESGDAGRYVLDREVSAVTTACMLVRREAFEPLNGFDSANHPYFLADVDFCLRLAQANWRIVWTPQATLLHDGPHHLQEGIRSALLSTTERHKLWHDESARLLDTWLPQLATDPHYPRAFSLHPPFFSLCQDRPIADAPLPWHPVPMVLAQPADRQGCGHYRISAPLLAMAEHGLVDGSDSTSFYSPIEIERLCPDVFLFQRPYTDAQYEQMLKSKRYGHGAVVFDLDDLITRIPPQSIHRGAFPIDVGARLKRAAHLCDRLVVSTPQLKEACRSWNDNIRVVPNYLPGARWNGLDPQRNTSDRPRVGWAGSLGHEGDLALIRDVVAKLGNEVEWVFLGECPIEMKHLLAEHYPPVTINQYPTALAAMCLDIAIAPLEINPFNEAKSSLKILEYGALGYPVICSDIAPYQGAFPVTRVRNRSQDWIKAIRELAMDKERRTTEGDRLRAHIRENWMLEDHLDEWFHAWTQD
ncbi:MAG: hypothetical protein CVU19_01720 [Betaproteobacteria bacterium HGW-Betaproteobacteria-13]|jgi:glycosyltransferase involved in cell wall biosynthesis|nr:MAG: hypothetical protein CVU19_01720 [Betaproteobacteria bacterium HGW-Betaproteobacteria-13]